MKPEDDRSQRPPSNADRTPMEPRKKRKKSRRQSAATVGTVEDSKASDRRPAKETKTAEGSRLYRGTTPVDKTRQDDTARAPEGKRPVSTAVPDEASMPDRNQPDDSRGPSKLADPAATPIGFEERLSVEDKPLVTAEGLVATKDQTEPELPEVDKITGVQLEAAWQKQGPPPLSGIDLTIIFGNGLLQYTALFIAVVAEFALLGHNLLPSVIAAGVDHWCKQPEEYLNMTVEEWRNISAPRDTSGAWDRCSRFEPPLSVDSLNRTQIPCREWDYDPNGGRSIIVEWDLVCGRRWLLTLGSVAYMAGAMLTAIIGGRLADHVGRRPVICIAVLVVVSAGMSICFVNTYPSFVVLRVFVASAVSTVRMTTLVLLFELSTAKHRCLYSVLAVMVSLIIAPAYLRVLGGFKPSWIAAEAAVMLPTTLLVCAFYVTAESPRWLVSRARYLDVERAMLWAAKMNGASVNETKRQWRSMWEALRQVDAELSAKGKSGLTGILTSPILRRLSAMVFACWIYVIIIYYTLARTRKAYSFWLTMASTAVKVPSVFITYRSMMRLGRRQTLCAVLVGFSFVFGCAALVAELGLNPALVQTMLRTCDALIDLCVTVLYTYSLELFPTEVRNMAMCTAYFLARAGSLVAPMMFDLTRTESIFTLSVIGVFTAYMVLFLPETMSCGIVDTIKDMDEANRQAKLARLDHHLKSTQATASQLKKGKRPQPKYGSDRYFKSGGHR